MDDCHSWGFIQTGVWLSGLVWAYLSLYCHVHWVQLLLPCSFNLQEKGRPGPKSILKRWCPVQEKVAALKDANLVCMQDTWKLEPEHIKKVVLHSAFGASTFYSAKGLPFAAAFPVQLCHLSPKLLGQHFPSCPHALSLILLFSWPCTSTLCCYCYVREVIATAVRVKPLSLAFSCTVFCSF